MHIYLINKDQFLRYIHQATFFITLFVIEFLATATVGVESVTLGWDKLNHLFAFMVLYILISLAFRDLSIALKVLLLFAFGLQIEIVQSFLPPREFSSFDMVADMVGIILGVLVYHAFIRKKSGSPPTRG
ncbi:MAG: VanZ family protein [Campylobacterales bacterium]|nr:VanZ family protein [Campylobacterales bacterium]